MTIYTFSTKKQRPSDEELVERLKAKCDTSGLVFSSVVIEALRRYESDERRKVQDNIRPSK